MKPEESGTVALKDIAEPQHDLTIGHNNYNPKSLDRIVDFVSVFCLYMCQDDQTSNRDNQRVHCLENEGMKHGFIIYTYKSCLLYFFNYISLLLFQCACFNIA